MFKLWAMGQPLPDLTKARRFDRFLHRRFYNLGNSFCSRGLLFKPITRYCVGFGR